MTSKAFDNATDANRQQGGRRNLIINGAMQVAQRGTSATVANNSNEGYSTLDRFLANFISNMGGSVTYEQVNAPAGTEFSKALKVTCASTTTQSADTGFELSTRFEGQDLQQLQYGTASARDVTVSFWVYTNKTGKYGVSLQTYTGATYDINGQVFEVTSSNTWQKVTLTFTGNTSASIVDSNALGMLLNIYLAAGSNRTGLASANTWYDYVSDRIPEAIVDFFDSTSNVFYLTGVQLEVGSTPTPFEHRSYGEELALCQRYYVKFNPTARFISLQYHTNYRMAVINYPVTMRSTPDIAWDDFNAAHTESAYTNENLADLYVGTVLDTVTESVDNVELNAEL